ncbi:hypothetical protein HPB51_025458 [Rhipicephalus microplus]|uniref:Transposable element n=1 Tax=Rhipicephalus microplus TaxID=6941 RepID=A0A9J6DR09_RHIMP|nr:hypothetical protein HPB51_025458 [Rhipicephalus microplus]
MKWYAKDVRPFDVFCDDGFLNVADELTAIGAKYESISATTVIPRPLTVSRRVSEVASELREVVMPEIQSAMKEGRCSMTLDMWTNDHKKIAYITATVHYSVLSQYDAIGNLLDSRGILLLEDVNKTLLTDVAYFLEPFKEASGKLEQDKVVTLPLVLMSYTKLKKHLTTDSTDSREVCQLKSRTLKFFQIKLPVEELHKVAAFLWPPFRHVCVLN